MNQSQMDALLALAAQKTGKRPQDLKAQMESGQTDALLSGVPKDKQAQIQALLSDPKAMERFVQQPQVQALLKALGAQNNKE